jgi:rsbT antagonist protein RsbS
MEVSVIQMLEDLLLVNVPANLRDSQVVQLRRETLRGIRQHRSRWVLLDFSQVDICDSFFGRFIHGMAETARLMGADVVISGLQDAVVETLVEMGFDLPDIHAVLDLDDALVMSRELKAAREAAELEEEEAYEEYEEDEPGDASMLAEPGQGDETGSHGPLDRAMREKQRRN